MIRHTDHLFSALSHLKKESIKVSAGSFVKKGEVIAQCGNSGRSPVPHLHVQFQATPQVGSATLDIPFSHYISKTEEVHLLRSFERPVEREIVSNIAGNELLKESYNFVPGQVICFREAGEKHMEASWEVKVDYANNTYLQCRQTGAKAYYVNEGDLFYFTHYEGSRESLLYLFFLGSYRVIFGFYPNLQLTDRFPVHILTRNPARALQDLLAPFFIFIKSSYRLDYLRMTENISHPEITLHSEANVNLSFRMGKKFNFELVFKGDRIDSFTVRENGKEPTAWVQCKKS